MKTNCSRIQNLLAFVLLSLLLVCYTGCKKELLIPTTEEGSKMINNDQLQKLYYQNKIDKKLAGKLNGQVEISWLPDWSQVKTITRDSIIYSYVPLEGILKKDGLSTKAQLLNNKQFLIIRDGKVFMKATYIPELVAGAKPSIKTFSLNAFSGVLLLDNLVTGEKRKFSYKKGLDITYKGETNKLLGDKRSNTGIKTMAWERQCEWRYACTFYTYCGPNAVIYLDESGGCQPPRWTVEDLYGNGSCSDNSWYLSFSEPFESCEYVYVQDPPPLPGDGGTGSGGVEPDALTEDNIENALIEETPQDTIKNFNKYLDCFNDGKTAQEYKLTLYVDQPVNGTNKQSTLVGAVPANGNLVLVIAGQKFDVGHAFVGFTKINTDGSSVRQVVGFYPRPSNILPGVIRPGVLEDNSGHAYDVSYTINVNNIEFTSALAQAKGDFQYGQYNIFNYNCTDAALKWMNAGGAGLDDVSRGVFKNTPGDLGQALRSKSGAVTTGGSAVGGKGPCN
ncbi:hypothetical protein [Pedobacter sp. Hv1]|uniref:hypothetical protein n=1 Tax=Pedobacter sp. Hv1 TaxID=1740090 RepID=UPI0006D8BF11|nr:hypothetical protein [Pedobacter sp. Hv1]KQB99796.1 hypothetical protein AQF98_14860 [Pedobacter sp. Hv1]